jgi:hypothetical protein
MTSAHNASTEEWATIPCTNLRYTNSNAWVVCTTAGAGLDMPISESSTTHTTLEAKLVTGQCYYQRSRAMHYLVYLHNKQASLFVIRGFHGSSKAAPRELGFLLKTPGKAAS